MMKFGIPETLLATGENRKPFRVSVDLFLDNATEEELANALEYFRSQPQTTDVFIVLGFLEGTWDKLPVLPAVLKKTWTRLYAWSTWMKSEHFPRRHREMQVTALEIALLETPSGEYDRAKAFFSFIESCGLTVPRRRDPSRLPGLRQKMPGLLTPRVRLDVWSDHERKAAGLVLPGSPIALINAGRVEMPKYDQTGPVATKFSGEDFEFDSDVREDRLPLMRRLKEVLKAMLPVELLFDDAPRSDTELDEFRQIYEDSKDRLDILRRQDIAAWGMPPHIMYLPVKDAKGFDTYKPYLVVYRGVRGDSAIPRLKEAWGDFCLNCAVDEDPADGAHPLYVGSMRMGRRLVVLLEAREDTLVRTWVGRPRHGKPDQDIPGSRLEYVVGTDGACVLRFHRKRLYVNRALSRKLKVPISLIKEADREDAGLSGMSVDENPPHADEDYITDRWGFQKNLPHVPSAPPDDDSIRQAVESLVSTAGGGNHQNAR